MRFSSALPVKPPQNPGGGVPGAQDAVATEPAPIVTIAAPWPPQEPPDDLDQRVRQVGEWQLGDW